MSDILVTIGQGETYQVTLGQGILPHALSHAIGGSDTLEEYYYPRSNPSGYAQSGDFATVQYVDDISGSLYSQISFPSNVVFTTGDQAINGAKNFSIRPTVNGTGVLLSGEGGGAVSTGDLVNVFYPLNTNPSGYITGVDLSLYQTVASATGVSGYLQNQINNIDLSNLETATGSLDVRVSAIESVSGDFVLDSNTGAFLTTGAGDSRYYPISSNPSGYITGVDLSDYALSSETGSFLTIEETGSFYPRFSNPLGYLVAADISSLASTEYVTGISGYLQGNISALQTATGDLNNRSIKTMFISGTSVKTVTLVRTDGSTISTTFTDISGDFSVASGYLQGQIDTLNSQTGDYVLTSETGSFLTVETDPIFSASTAYSINSTLTGQWGTSYNDSITGIDVVGTSSKIITLYQRDGSTLTASFSDIEGTGGGGNDYFLTGASFNSANGDLNLYLNDGSVVTESLDGRYATGSFLTSESGDSRYYPLSSNPSDYLVSSDISNLESATGNLNTRLQSVESLSGQWDTSYNRSITGLSVSGTTTKTISLFSQSGGIISGSFEDSSGGSSIDTTVIATKGGTDQTENFTTNTYIQVTFGTEVQDDDGDFASSTLTVEAGEIWIISGAVTSQPSGNAYAHLLSLFKDGSIYKKLSVSSGYSVPYITQGFYIIVSEAGDYTIRLAYSFITTKTIEGDADATYLICRRLK